MEKREGGMLYGNLVDEVAGALGADYANCEWVLSVRGAYTCGLRGQMIPRGEVAIAAAPAVLLAKIRRGGGAMEYDGVTMTADGHLTPTALHIMTAESATLRELSPHVAALLKGLKEQEKTGGEP